MCDWDASADRWGKEPAGRSECSDNREAVKVMASKSLSETGLTPSTLLSWSARAPRLAAEEGLREATEAAAAWSWASTALEEVI